LENGAAGVNGRGAGGGSNPKREKPGGGGGGGAHELKPHSRGKLPLPILLPQINAPSPKPPTIKNPSLPVPATIQVDPLLVQNDPRLLPFGDPKSQSTELSAGPGDGGGIGDGQGGGIGPGSGTGYGPGRDFNTGGGPAKVGGPDPGGDGDNGHRPLRVQDVSRKAQIITRPEPQYTEDARKNSVTGEVMLRAVLSADGRVTNIQPMKRLPDGLTEKAIAAARLINFTPAEKDGRAVSQYVTLVYNFNIY
ncbi:MAG: energy transducer TonB, partial [Acidobacteriota bacterium]|nr:energy transducer TonB [Acidobacteriota bacterium]